VPKRGDAEVSWLGVVVCGAFPAEPDQWQLPFNSP
jgi:hypothetical protein